MKRLSVKKKEKPNLDRHVRLDYYEPGKIGSARTFACSVNLLTGKEKDIEIAVLLLHKFRYSGMYTNCRIRSIKVVKLGSDPWGRNDKLIKKLKTADIQKELNIQLKKFK